MTGTVAVKSAFHELDLPDADELVVKSRLLRFVAEEVRKRGLSETDAGALLNLDQGTVSALLEERITQFTVEGLMTLVGRLGFELTIHIEGGGIELDLPFRHAA